MRTTSWESTSDHWDKSSSDGARNEYCVSELSWFRWFEKSERHSRAERENIRSVDHNSDDEHVDAEIEWDEEKDEHENLW